MQHFLITRYNLKKKDWSKDKNGKEILTKAWHDERARLFLDYCLPSVQAQTNKNFDWIVFFQEDLKHLISPEILNSKAFFPYFADSYEDFEFKLWDVLNYYDDELTISSRLDNDDMVSPDFIADIQALATPDYCIDVPNGEKLYLDTGKRKPYTVNNNHFISLCERKGEKKGVFHRMHFEYRTYPTIRAKKRLWTEVIHSTNKINR